MTVHLKSLLPVIAALSLASPMPALAQSPEAVANAALENAPVWDGHNDLPIQLRSRYRNAINTFDFHDGEDVPANSQGSTSVHTDLPRLA